MESNEPIDLHLTARALDAYCRDLARRSPTLERRVAAVDALITFLSSQTGSGEQAKPEYLAIRQTLLRHFDEAREALLDERAGRLLNALETRRLPYVAMLHGSVSRDAFWSLLHRVEQRMAPRAVEALRGWGSAWLAQVRQKATEASPYPDALDIAAAGVDLSDYLAMMDICRYFGLES